MIPTVKETHSRINTEFEPASREVEDQGAGGGHTGSRRVGGKLGRQEYVAKSPIESFSNQRIVTSTNLLITKLFSFFAIMIPSQRDAFQNKH